MSIRIRENEIDLKTKNLDPYNLISSLTINIIIFLKSTINIILKSGYYNKHKYLRNH